MFSQSKQGTPFSLGGPSVPGSQNKPAKPRSPAEAYELALVTANVFLDASRARVAKSMEAYSAVADNSYWKFGYIGVNTMATMAACMALGNRFALLRSYSGWIALAGGFGGGSLCMSLHTSTLLAGVAKQLDQEVAEAKRMDEQTQHVVPDYLKEAERLTQVKYELMPNLPEAVAARSQHVELTLDDRADALIDAYTKRREALNKK